MVFKNLHKLNIKFRDHVWGLIVFKNVKINFLESVSDIILDNDWGLSKRQCFSPITAIIKDHSKLITSNKKYSWCTLCIKTTKNVKKKNDLKNTQSLMFEKSYLEY